MKKLLAVATILGAVALTVPAAHAQGFKGAGKYATGLIENNPPPSGNPTCAGNCSLQGYSFMAEKSKVQIKPSGKDGDGGIVTQLNLKFVDCPGEEGNDGGAAGKCGPSGSPAEDHVFVLQSKVADLVTTAGILFNIEKGKASFQATGKNKVGGAALAGPLITAVFSQPLAIGLIEIKTPGSDVNNSTTGCGALPLPDPNTCADGTTYAVGGIRVGEDQSLHCTSSTECSLAQVCSILFQTCVNETCTIDSDCDQNGGGNGGTGECGSDGECCDPAIEPGCAAQVP